jgi:hypothetical protein
MEHQKLWIRWRRINHARAKVEVLKKEKVEFGVGHDKLVKDLEDLDKAQGFGK